MLRIFEMVAGQRMMTSYFRIGGLALEPPLGFFERVQAFIQDFPEKIDEYSNLLTGNPIFVNRLKGVGHLSGDDAVALGVTGPVMRASGIDFDVRRDMPYSSYEKFQFEVPVSNGCDCWARYVCRLEEMRESVKICSRRWTACRKGRSRPMHRRSCCRIARDEDADGGADPSLQDRDGGVRGSGGRGLSGIESGHGQVGLLRGFGRRRRKPYRVHMRYPSFADLQALETMCQGRMLADVVAVIGSIDIVLGEIDR